MGEMIGALKEGCARVPEGFATTSQAYRQFLESNALDSKIRSQLEQLENGDALGITYQDDEPLAGADKLADRDRNLRELDPASAEDAERGEEEL